MKRLSIAIFACVLILLAPLRHATSQEVTSLRQREMIRLTVASPDSPKVKGRLVSVSSEAIALTGVNNSRPISFANIRLIEVKRRTSGSFMRSVAFGLLGGVAVGASWGLAGPTDTGDGILTAGDKTLIGSVLGGAAGLIGGTIFGGCCSSTWSPVPLPEGRTH